jgi:hypothetical protein
VPKHTAQTLMKIEQTHLKTKLLEKRWEWKQLYAIQKQQKRDKNFLNQPISYKLTYDKKSIRSI